jgi:hypothetical protein
MKITIRLNLTFILLIAVALNMVLVIIFDVNKITAFLGWLCVFVAYLEEYIKESLNEKK